MWLALLAWSLVSNLPMDELGTGVSVSGWVRAVGAESNGAEVEISPLHEEPMAIGSSSAVTNRRRFVGHSDERGRFEIRGVPPGLYRIEAGREGFASEPVRLEVPPRGSTLYLEEPLDLVPMARLEIAFEPAADPWGQPWSVELSQAVGEMGQHSTVAEGEANPAGSWSSEPLRPTVYMVDIQDSQGSRWGYRELELVGGREEVFWPIEVVYLEGTLSLGDEPLAGIGLVWGPNRENIRLESDENGRFEGFLPREGLWPLEIALSSTGRSGAALAPVEVRRRPGKRAAEVEVRLPDTRLRGRVLAEGEPVQAVVVALTESELLGKPHRQKKAFDLFTDEDGRFEVLGLVPDTIEITASARGLASDTFPVQIREGETIEIEIEIRERVPLRGRLVSSFADQAGAVLLVHPDAGYSFEATTLRDGRFELPLGPDVSRVDLAVIPPVGGVFLHRLHPEAGSPDRVLEVGRATGTLVFPDVATLLLGGAGGKRHYLFYDGVGLPADALIKKMIQRMAPHPSGGMALPSMAVGTWSLCKGPDPTHPDCQRAQLFEGAEIMLGSHSAETDESSEE